MPLNKSTEATRATIASEHITLKLKFRIGVKVTKQGLLKGGSITVPLTSSLTGLDKSVLQIKTKIISCRTADSKPVKQEVNSTVILPPLVFPEQRLTCSQVLAIFSG